MEIVKKEDTGDYIFVWGFKKIAATSTSSICCFKNEIYHSTPWSAAKLELTQTHLLTELLV